MASVNARMNIDCNSTDESHGRSLLVVLAWIHERIQTCELDARRIRCVPVSPLQLGGSRRCGPFRGWSRAVPSERVGEIGPAVRECAVEWRLASPIGRLRFAPCATSTRSISSRRVSSGCR